MRDAWRVANGVMLLAFGLGVAVQFNDPDPLAWVLIYGLAAFACALALAGRGHWAIPAAVAWAALVWGLAIVPPVLGRVPFFEMFGAWEMESLAVEESREMYGLAIIASWMTVLAVRSVRSGRSMEGGGPTA